MSNYVYEEIYKSFLTNRDTGGGSIYHHSCVHKDGWTSTSLCITDCNKTIRLEVPNTDDEDLDIALEKLDTMINSLYSLKKNMVMARKICEETCNKIKEKKKKKKKVLPDSLALKNEVIEESD